MVSDACLCLATSVDGDTDDDGDACGLCDVVSSSPPRISEVFDKLSDPTSLKSSSDVDRYSLYVS